MSNAHIFQKANERERMERLESEVRAWKETARQYANNQAYYHGIVIEVGRLLGNDVYVSDDGSVQDEVIAEKVPQAVAKLIAAKPQPQPVATLCEAVEQYFLWLDDKTRGSVSDAGYKERDAMRHALTAERKRAVLVNALVDSVRVWYKDSGRFDIIRARLHQLDAFDKGAENG